MRLTMIFGAAALLLPGAASAQKVDPRLEAVLACPKIADSAQRLACFDSAIAPLRKAAEAGALEARSLGPKALEARIRAMKQQGYDRMLVQFDNGDRWIFQLEGNERMPKAGDAVTVKRGALGNWWVKVVKGQTFQAKFLGQPD